MTTILREDLTGGDSGQLADLEYAYGVINRMRHIAQVTNAGSFNVLNDTETEITWDTETADEFGYHAASPTPQRLIVPAGVPTGWYRATLHIGFPSNATGLRSGLIVPSSGSTVTDSRTAVSGRRTDITMTGIFQLAALQYVHAVAYQNSGGTLALSASNTRFSLQRLCDA